MRKRELLTSQNKRMLLSSQALIIFLLLSSRALVVVLLLSFLIIVTSSQAQAHRINIYAYAKEGMVFTESWYSGGDKCKGGEVSVYDKELNIKLIEGKTDDHGFFSFAIPKVAPLKLVLRDKTGHKDTFVLAAVELEKAMSAGARPLTLPDKKGIAPPAGLKPSLTEAEIELIVERALDKKIDPVLAVIGRLEKNLDKPGVTEIIGGVGYIVGIFGLLMYFKSRRAGKLNKG